MKTKALLLLSLPLATLLGCTEVADILPSSSANAITMNVNGNRWSSMQVSAVGVSYPFATYIEAQGMAALTMAAIDKNGDGITLALSTSKDKVVGLHKSSVESLTAVYLKGGSDYNMDSIEVNITAFTGNRITGTFKAGGKGFALTDGVVNDLKIK